MKLFVEEVVGTHVMRLDGSFLVSKIMLQPREIHISCVGDGFDESDLLQSKRCVIKLVDLFARKFLDDKPAVRGASNKPICLKHQKCFADRCAACFKLDCDRRFDKVLVWMQDSGSYSLSECLGNDRRNGTLCL
jgi:hypothetical protein